MDIFDLDALENADLSDFEDMFTDALETLGDYDASFDFETVLEDYFCILQKICGCKPQSVTIDREYKYGVTVDGTPFDFADCITEKDLTESGCMHEIASLIDDFGFEPEDIEKALNEKIDAEWE